MEGEPLELDPKGWLTLKEVKGQMTVFPGSRKGNPKVCEGSASCCTLPGTRALADGL